MNNNKQLKADLKAIKKEKKANRKFYQKKRFIIPIVFLGFILMTNGGESDTDKPETKANVVKVETPVKKVKAVTEVKKEVLTPEQITKNKEVAKAKAIKDTKAKEVADHKAWIEKQFSPYDGAHYDLESLVKDYLNDPKSFKHVSTTYYQKSDTTLEILMLYRAKNSYGALVLQNVTAISDKTKNTITITSQND